MLTCDRLIQCNVNCNTVCSLCDVAVESAQKKKNVAVECLDHMCPYSAAVWCTVLSLLGIQRRAKRFSGEVLLAQKICMKSTARA